MPTYTTNYGLIIPEFNARGWHTAIGQNLRVLDALIGSAIPIARFTGEYQNSTMYSVGDKAVDPETGAIYTAQVEHTSAATGTFAADRADRPSYWAAFALEASFRGEWEAGEVYTVNDFVVDDLRYAVCVETHTSGSTFAADSSKWTVLIDLTDPLETAQQAADDAAVSAAAAAASAGTNIGWLQSARTITSDEVLDKDTDNGLLILIDASGGDVTVTLPAASGAAGFRCAIKRLDGASDAAWIARAGSDTIDGATLYELAAQYDCVVISRRTGSTFSIVSVYNQFLNNDAATARAALGLGTAAVANSGDFLASASNLSDVDDAAASFTAIKQPASEEATGVVSFATEAECVTGTETGKATTPAGVAAAIVAGSATFPSGTKMLFVQTAAPTGWTKDTDLDNHALRLVSGTVGSGGTADFSSAFASRTPTGNISINSFSIAAGNLPASGASLNTILSGSGTGSVTGFLWSNIGGTDADGGGGGGPRSSNNLGSGTAITPTGSFTGVAMNFAVKYQDVIKATKD